MAATLWGIPRGHWKDAGGRRTNLPSDRCYAGRLLFSDQGRSALAARNLREHDIVACCPGPDLDESLQRLVARRGAAQAHCDVRRCTSRDHGHWPATRTRVSDNGSRVCRLRRQRGAHAAPNHWTGPPTSAVGLVRRGRIRLADCVHQRGESPPRTWRRAPARVCVACSARRWSGETCPAARRRECAVGRGRGRRRLSASARWCSGARARRASVVVECALAVALLAGAGLLLKSFVRVETVNPGFEAKQVLLVRINSARLARELLDRIASLPGVQAVGAIRSFDPMNPDIAITAEGQPSLRAPLTSERVTAGFFQAMRVPLRTGRHFTEEDGRGMAIVNQTMAKTFWPRKDPIGKRCKRGASDSTSRWMTVIGVVGDMRRRGLERDAVSEFYEPEIEPSMELAIRTTTDPLGHVASVRQVIRSFDGHAVIGRVTTVENHLEELGAARRFQTWLIAVFAGLGLMLSAIGIYGVMHYAVAQRTHEMGIRIALGAEGSHVLWLVIGEGLRLALIGVAAGLLAALQLTGVMARLLFEVSATDPAIFAIVPVMLTIVAVLACYLPARRASKVDPIVALRYE